jgi:hypothetical protein
VLEDFGVFSVGIMLFSLSVFTHIAGQLALMFFIISLSLMGLAGCDMYRVIFDAHPLQALKKFRSNRQGLVWLWIVDFILDYPFDIIVNTVTPIYTMTGFMASAWNAVQITIAWLLAFSLIFAITHLIQNAKAPQGMY